MSAMFYYLILLLLNLLNRACYRHLLHCLYCHYRVDRGSFLNKLSSYCISISSIHWLQPYLAPLSAWNHALYHLFADYVYLYGLRNSKNKLPIYVSVFFAQVLPVFTGSCSYILLKQMSICAWSSVVVFMYVFR